MLHTRNVMLVSGVVLLVTMATCVMADEIAHTVSGVIDKWKTNSNVHRRVKRAISKDIVGFSRSQQLDIMTKHNSLRSTRNASDMLYMEWDPKLEQLAQGYAEKCIFVHNPKRKAEGYSYVGENLYAAGGLNDPLDLVQGWFSEDKSYNYTTNSCKGVCGHYTQIVWATSQALGCGIKWCDPLLNVSFHRGFNFVCNYGPGGNIIGRSPYSLGEPCSKCPEDHQYCVNGLCSLRPQIGSGSTRVHNSTSHCGLLFLILIVVLQLVLIVKVV